MDENNYALNMVKINFLNKMFKNKILFKFYLYNFI